MARKCTYYSDSKPELCADGESKPSAKQPRRATEITRTVRYVTAHYQWWAILSPLRDLRREHFPTPGALSEKTGIYMRHLRVFALISALIALLLPFSAANAAPVGTGLKPLPALDGASSGVTLVHRRRYRHCHRRIRRVCRRVGRRRGAERRRFRRGRRVCRLVVRRYCHGRGGIRRGSRGRRI